MDGTSQVWGPSHIRALAAPALANAIRVPSGMLTVHEQVGGARRACGGLERERGPEVGRAIHPLYERFVAVSSTLYHTHGTTQERRGRV